MADTEPNEELIRAVAFDWLREHAARYGGVLPWSLLLQGFTYNGSRVTLAGPPGIWKPAVFSHIPLSIRTSSNGPYDDAVSFNQQLLYRYRDSGPDHSDNRGLREAIRTQTPLIYLYAVGPGHYVPIWPVFIEGDNRKESFFVVRIAASYALPIPDLAKLSAFAGEEASGIELRRYVNSVVQRRLHQGMFRTQVLRAYRTRCTLCSLRHEELLDAAHIIADGDDRGDPIVTNGLSLCKIHHAAYDQNIIGISPEYRIRVREDILREIDGPMLRYGLQELNSGAISLPARKADWPDRDRLSERYSRFLQVS